MYLLRTCSHPRTGGYGPDGHSAGDTIDVAIEYSPLTFFQRADTLGGFDYDLLRAIAVEGSLNLKFHPFTSLPSALKGLDDDQFDIVVADAPSTAELSERYAISEPAYLDRQVLVQRSDTAGGEFVSTALDLAGKRVWVPEGSPAAARLAALADEIGDSIKVESEAGYSSEQLFILVATGEIERAVVNEKIARALAADYPDVDITTGVSFNQFQSWLMRRDDQKLVSRIDTLLTAFKSTPEYALLIIKYFGEE